MALQSYFIWKPNISTWVHEQKVTFKHKLANTDPIKCKYILFYFVLFYLERMKILYSGILNKTLWNASSYQIIMASSKAFPFVS